MDTSTDAMLGDQDRLDQQAAQASAQRDRPAGPVAAADDFHMSQMPQSVFPKGLNADGQFGVYPEQLAAVKGQMVGGTELGQLTSTLAQLISYGGFGAGIGGWDTADGFGSNADNAYEGITQFMQALNSAYDMVATSVGKAAQNYSDADDATASAANSIGSEAGPGSLAG
jgi:hypothetical protein